MNFIITKQRRRTVEELRARCRFFRVSRQARKTNEFIDKSTVYFQKFDGQAMLPEFTWPLLLETCEDLVCKWERIWQAYQQA